MRIAILCGGKSVEHEISLLSARNIRAAIDPKKYEVMVITIDKKGVWHLNSPTDNPLALIPGQDSVLISVHHNEILPKIDVAFPVLHGQLGEDGTVQGLLKLANIPFVGSDVLGSAIGMDKDVMKRLLREANISIAKFIVVHADEYQSTHLDFSNIVEKLGLPFFIKPANAGSSVGINKIYRRDDFNQAVKIAFEYDNKILIEEYVMGREIECAVLGNASSPIASKPGEIITQADFYSYEAKYLDKHPLRLEIPAKLPENIIQRVQELAIQVFKTLCCAGMARVDFFLTNQQDIIVNELNTIPGFTPVSMYPQMWEATGIGYPELIERLIQLALEKFEMQKRLKTEFMQP